MVNGELQDANAAASTRHSNVEPASVEVNENVGVLSLGASRGARRDRGVRSASVSTVNDRLAGDASMLPTPSVGAHLERVCSVRQRGGR